jgi:hypothetical protein
MRTQVINIWSSPRNISTALMYSFAQRNDMTVVDEPLYAHYLRVSGANHPVKEKIIHSQNPFAKNVIKDVILNDYATPYSLHKQMTHHLVDLDWSFLLQSKNVIIIRNPREIIASYVKVISNPTIKDVGIKKQMDVYRFLSENDKLATVIDTNELLKNPKKILTALCKELGIPFDDKMLSWNAGAIKEDGIWAEHWYANVHRSTGFKKHVKKEVYLSEELEELAKECMPFYEQLFDKCVKV